MPTDEQIEQEIQDQNLVAPRVTPDHIEAVIADEYYFTGQEGAKGAQIGKPTYQVNPALSLLTFCVLVLRNGFTVVGKSACASPDNFNEELGRKIARKDAVNQIWPLEGYLLRQNLYEQNVSTQTGASY